MAAAANNAAWCDAVFRARGAGGRFLPELWFSAAQAPRFYPNLVTLSPDGAAAQIERIGALAGAKGAEAWAVKDSFATLDLAPLGFDLLFEAEWLRRPPESGGDATGWTRIASATELIEWEAAWSGAPAAALFAPALLGDRRHAFLAHRRMGFIVAGGVASLVGGVIGLSNLFGPEACRRGCLAAAGALAPDLPLVGYEPGAASVALQALGFRTLGPLRVWQRQAGPSK